MEHRTRRRVLQQIGAVTVGAVSAGCLRITGDNPMSRPIQSPTPHFPLFIEGLEDFNMGDAPQPTLATRFGASEDSHQVIAFAETPGSLEATFKVRRLGQEETFWEGTATLSSSEYAFLEFRKANDYVLEVTSSGHMGEVIIPEDHIDCRDSVTGLILRIGGGIKRQDTISPEECEPEESTDDSSDTSEETDDEDSTDTNNPRNETDEGRGE